MRRLIIANTYSQLLLAIQLRNTLFFKDEIVLLLSDHSRGAKEVAAAIEKLELFNGCYFIKSAGLCLNRKSTKRLKDFWNIAFEEKSSYSFYLAEVSNKQFDEMICYNFMIDMFAVYSELSKINPMLKVSLYEEGLLSYGVSVEKTCGRTIINWCRKIQEKEIVTDHLDKFYCFYPSIYKGKLNAVQVPRVTAESETAKQLKIIFELDKKKLNYFQKYIFFTSVYDFEGGKPVGEYDLVRRVADLVGKDNLLVKQHPRDKRTIYIDNGFNVDENSSVPWEAIQLSRDFKDKVFLTVNSVSVLAASTMSSYPVPTYYMYKMCDYSENSSCKKNMTDIENLLKDEEMRKILESVHIANREEDII